MTDAQADAQTGAQADAQSVLVVPGFTDWHVHVSLVGNPMPAGSLITRVLDLGASLDTVQKAAHAAHTAHAADTTADTIIYAGAFLTAEGGYPSDRDWAEPGSWRFVASRADAISHVTEMAAGGASVIKVSLNSVAGPVLSDELLREIKSAAQNVGLPVVTHAEGPGQAQRARECGADYLAHTPFSEVLSDAEIAAQAAAVGWISTLDMHGRGTPDEKYRIALANLTRFARADGLVLYGTDMGNGEAVPGLNPREIAALQDAGLRDEQLLRALTGPAPGLERAAGGRQTVIHYINGKLDFINAKPI